MSSLQSWDASEWGRFRTDAYNDLASSRGDATFSVEKFAAFCADSDGPLSEEELASARRLCRELQERQADPEAW